jgi:hypothetical protein
MSFFDQLDMDKLTPVRIWAAMSPESRMAAAKAVFASDEQQHRLEADMAIAVNLKFRPAAVRKLPLEKRAGYVARAFRPDDSFASTLLLCLHTGERVDLLTTYLDSLGVPHKNGLIDEEHDMEAPTGEALIAAVDTLLEKFERECVELYLATLLSMDPETWAGLRDQIDRIR